MSTVNIFEQASRLRLTFVSDKGVLGVEDLWNLPLTSHTGKANLDDMARNLYNQLKESSEISFVTPAQKTNAGLQLSFDIVKHVIDTRVAERDATAVAAVRAEKKRTLLALIEQKETEELAGSSLEELRKQVLDM